MSISLLIMGGLVGLLITFVVVYFAINSIIEVATEEDSTVKDRLTVLKKRDKRAAEAFQRKIEIEQVEEEEDEENQQTSLMDELFLVMEPMAQNFYSKPHRQKRKDELSKLLMKAGQPNGEAAVNKLIAEKFAKGALALVFSSLAALMSGNDLMMAVAIVAIAVKLGFGMPESKLRKIAKKRSKELYARFPDTLDLMVVCVEGGLGMDSTVQRVSRDIAPNSPIWSEELTRVTRDLNAGLPRAEVYRNLSERCDVEEVRSLCSLLIQSEKLGTSIASVLRVYAEDVRIRRRQIAEELAYKASVKMTPVLVLFIFPSLGIVLLGPALYRSYKVIVMGETLDE